MGQCLSSEKPPRKPSERPGSSPSSPASPTTSSPHTASPSSSPPAATRSVAQPPSESADVGERWWYIDLQQVVQGPFSTLQMLKWFEGGLLPETLQIRTDTDRIGVFSPLKERTGFLQQWKPGCGMTFAQWEKQQQAHAEPHREEPQPVVVQPPQHLQAPPRPESEVAESDPSDHHHHHQQQQQQQQQQHESHSHQQPVEPHTSPSSFGAAPSAPHDDAVAAAPSILSQFKPGGLYYYVSFAYAASEPDELTISYNQIVEVLRDGRTPPSNWEYVRIMSTGEEGLVPGNYVKPLPDLHSCPVAVATGDWVAPDEPKPGHCLKLKKGDEIVIVDQHVSGWWTGVSKGLRGMYPKHFCSIHA